MRVYFRNKSVASVTAANKIQQLITDSSRWRRYATYWAVD